ncbi:MAG: TPM domain-containing protein [Treponema sp.]|jgi:uncharacterized protein|nr:TPM domain-containing protein [Treponema sp.]
MKNKFLTLTALIFFLSAPLFAQRRVVDNAGLLNNGEIAALEEIAKNIAANYNFDLVILTVKDIGSASPEDYADDYFDYNGYGLGEDRDGCLFLQVTGSRDICFSTSGRGIKILTAAAYDKLDSAVDSYLKNEDPSGAYRAFFDTWEMFLALNLKGKNYNFFYRYNIILVAIAWVISLLIGIVVVQSWKKQMDTVLVKEQADSFIIPGSLAFTQQTDSFLFSTVTKIARPKSTSLGNVTHTGSSGRKHGGGGRKY